MKARMEAPSLLFSRKLPDPRRFGADALLIHDRRLRVLHPGFSGWTSKFPRSYAVDSGEALKDVARFPAHLSRIVELTRDLSSRKLVVVSVGGGTVGDFSGFVASILKRGVDLVHIPSTWLSAIDSAHGGKTGLNVGLAKNQIGTFHQAREIHLVRSLLESQGPDRESEALGELIKIALIQGGSLFGRLEKAAARPAGVRHGTLLWEALPEAIEAKYRVVRADPQERTGHRQILNLGHTLGHVLEISRGIPHGTAVSLGTAFALEWSWRKGLLETRSFERAIRLLARLVPGAVEPARPAMARARARQLLLQDKKRGGRGEVTFIFLERIGKAARVPVRIEELLDEAARQGRIRGK